MRAVVKWFLRNTLKAQTALWVGPKEIEFAEFLQKDAKIVEEF